MAAKEKELGNQEAAVYLLIEELKVKKKTSQSVFDGTCSANGWKPGKAVTEQEYDLAVAKFLSGGTGGKKC